MERARRRNTAEKRLRVSEIAKLPPGWHEDGGGLRLVVEPDREDGKPGPCRWVLRVTIAGKRRNRGLGPYPLVTLDKARERGDRYPARRPRRPRPDQGAAAAARQSRHLPPGLRGLLREQEKDAIDSKHRQQWSSRSRPTSTRRSATCGFPTSRTPTCSASSSRSGSTRPRPPGACCSAWSWCSKRRSCLASAKERRPALASGRR